MINNPLIRTIKGAQIMAKTNAPTLEEAAAIEKVLRYRNETYADAWALNLNLALRISDLLALTYKDVAGTEIRITEGKTKKARVIPINEKARKIINRRRAAYPEDIFLFQSRSNRVKSQAARPVTRESASRAFSEAGEMVTDKNIGTHSARQVSRACVVGTWCTYRDNIQNAEPQQPIGHHDVPRYHAR